LIILIRISLLLRFIINKLIKIKLYFDRLKTFFILNIYALSLTEGHFIFISENENKKEDKSSTTKPKESSSSSSYPVSPEEGLGDTRGGTDDSASSNTSSKTSNYTGRDNLPFPTFESTFPT
jgi:general stress protein CsbA